MMTIYIYIFFIQVNKSEYVGIESKFNLHYAK